MLQFPVCAFMRRSPADLLMSYWDSMAKLENKVLKKEFRPQEVIMHSGWPMTPTNRPGPRNKAIDAMLYFGQKSWPDDFLLAFGSADGGGERRRRVVLTL